MKSEIQSIEYYLPKKFEDSNDLLSDNPNWDINKIISKTGIKKRWVSGKEETSMDLALEASKKVLKKIDKNEIDTLIFVTQCPDYFLPTSACVLQHKLGLSKDVKCFDINQGCTGFVYGLSISSSLIESGVSDKVLLICSDTYTKFINKNDRTNRPIFSDGASATIVGRSEEEKIGPFIFGTDGSGYKSLIVEEGAARSNFKTIKNSEPELFMSGAGVFVFAQSVVPKNIKDLLNSDKSSLDDIDMFFFHQGSKLILESISDKLSLENNKVFKNYEFLGNTVSSTIPIAIKVAFDLNKIKKDNKILLFGFGVGLSWGSCLVKFSDLI